MIEDFGLLSFHPLAIEDRNSVRALVALIDKANGYVFGGLARQGGVQRQAYGGPGSNGRLVQSDGAGAGQLRTAVHFSSACCSAAVTADPTAS